MTSTSQPSRKDLRLDGATAVDAEPTDAAPAVDPKAAMRARIEPIARMVAVFVMPLIIVGMMITGYLGAMHSPQPNDMPVVVAGAASARHAVADALTASDDDAIAVDTVANPQEARDRVFSRDAAAAVILDGTTATVVTATGAGAMQVTVVTSLVTPVLLDQGLTIQTEDLAPLPASDPSGLVAVFLATALVMAGYLPFSVMRSNSPELLKFRRIVPVLAGWAAVIAGLAWLVTGPIMGVVSSDHYLPVLGIAWLGVFSISCVQLFITRLFGPLGVIAGMFLLMVIGMPASNMSMSMYTLPGFYRVMHEILPMGAIGESLRSVLYFGGTGVARHLIVLAIGAVVGLVATKVFDATRGRRYPEGVALDVNIPSLHGGRRPDRTFWRYASLVVFPLAMVTMMLSAMLGAMHQPTPRDLPVAVVAATEDQADQVIAGLEKNLGGMFDFTAHTTADTDELRDQVEGRDLVAAIVLPSQDSPEFTLIANQAGSSSAYQVVTRVFTQVAGAQQLPLQIDDTTPLPDSDKNGVDTLYLAMGWILAGFMVIVVSANAAPATRRLRTLLPLVAGYAVFMSAVIWMIGGPITGSIDGHFLPMWGAGIIAIFSVSMFTMVFERLLGMLAIIPAMGVLMFLGVPSSNGPFSMYMAPEWFRTLHDFLPMPAAVETIRSILYFGGDVVAEHLQVLGLWGLVSLALVFVIDALKPVRTAHDFGNLIAPRSHSHTPAPAVAEEVIDPEELLVEDAADDRELVGA